MKILLISTKDISGGAAVAANRLHEAFRKNGIESFMLVQEKQTEDKYIYGKSKKSLRGEIDKIPKILYPKRKEAPWNIAWLRNFSVISKIKKINPDIIHLHWVNGGFLSIKNIREISELGKPIVWTLHDMWTFTGGCHYAGDCKKYKKICGSCPQLGSKKENDLSFKIWKSKQKNWNELDLNFVTCSNWLKGCVEESALLKEKSVVAIQNCLDTTVYKPLSKEKIRKKLKLPLNKKIILFGAMSSTSDKRKGFDYLQKALKILSEKMKNEDICLVVFGNSDDFDTSPFPFEVKALGKLSGDAPIVEAYNCADVFVGPSLEDNLPNTFVESLSCGTPTVGFNIGGIPDMVVHKKNGYLAKALNSKDLAEGIKWCIEDEKRSKELSKNAREYALENYSEKVVVQKFKDFYNNLLN